MNGPLIFTIIQIIKALECVEEENMATTATNVTEAATNGTSSHIERQVLADQTSDEEEMTIPTDPPPKVEELSDLVKLLKKHCTCPCSGVKHIPVCGKTTNGLMKTFDSQCHLICHNQCGQAERYAVKFYGACPLVPSAPPPILTRKNVYSTSLLGNRRTDGAIATGVAAGGSYESFITPLEQECHCAHCQQTRFIRLDYYPICAERSGHRVTFESWCHFDCENKCVRYSGYPPFLYKHKGPCRLSVQVEREDDFGVRRTAHPSPPSAPAAEVVSHIHMTAEPCSACTTRCNAFYEPVCTKNSRNEYLSFKSRCHMRCHNLCEFEDPENNFEHILDGQCPWLRAI